MQEAKYSLNARFNLNGFDSQITIRSDEKPQELINEFEDLLINLQHRGATPERRWENSKASANKAPEKPEQSPKKAEPTKPECPIHHKAVPSKNGGLYCPTKLNDGSWCKWTA